MTKIKSVFVLDKAVSDLNEGKKFYNMKSDGVGNYFFDSLIADIESLVLYAGIHKRKYGLYQMFSRRFPYAIYYDIRNDNAYILAVLPMKRDPDWITRHIHT